MNTNEIAALAEKIVNDGLNIYYVPKVKCWFEWNDELAAWVVIREDRINEKLFGILQAGYQDAIANGDMELVQDAINLFKPSMKARLIKAIRTVATRGPEFLQGDVACADVVQVEEVETLEEIMEASENGLPELDSNENVQDDRF